MLWVFVGGGSTQAGEVLYIIPMKRPFLQDVLHMSDFPSSLTVSLIRGKVWKMAQVGLTGNGSGNLPWIH